MIHIISFSTGLSSAICVERVYQRYNAESMRIVFMDTLIEDDDNYRFKREMYERWRGMGIEIVDLMEGRDPYQVSKDAQFISNQKAAPCTFRLKIEPFVTHLKSITDDITIHIGYDYSEVHRTKATTKNYTAHGWLVDYPLLWKPYELRPYSQVSRDDWNIEPPRMYQMGYSHANCGGMCVKQGKGDWTRTLINFPERFAQIEKWEREMRDHPVRQNYAILRDQSNGTVRPMTLEELRTQHESSPQLSLFDFDNGCVQCGIGDLLDAVEGVGELDY